ncbi:hypothetical protein M9Y10_022258 [Tritrichomonas musculus]|uniref:Leucine Rich Repeat family protein n=1 Tax=Tritrichomonas musculus TaxID=1915356 RepID=A0ABR2KRQ6_9EUKA
MLLSKCPILESEPLCLRATGAGITEIDTLSPQQTDALSLYVSHNQISKIDKIIQFKSLERLLIECNQISYLEDLKPLAQLPKLKELRMKGNPVCHLTLFPIYVLYLVPTLESLNGEKVENLFKKVLTKPEIEKYISAENKILKYILMSDVIINQLDSSPKEKIKSVAMEASKEYSPDAIIERYGQIRKEAIDLPIDQYFDYLKDLLIQKHQKISQLTGSSHPDDAKAKIHDENLANLPSSNQLDQLVKSLTELNDSACLIIEDDKIDSSDRKSITSFFGKKFGFNFDRAKSVSPKYVVQKSRNRDAQSTVTRNTDAQSILEYYLGDDENIDARSTKSARTSRSSRRQGFLDKMKQGNYSPKSNRRKNKHHLDTSSQASIDDVALNIEDGKITLIDPKHPEENIFPNISTQEPNDEKEQPTSTENTKNNETNETDATNEKNEANGANESKGANESRGANESKDKSEEIKKDNENKDSLSNTTTTISSIKDSSDQTISGFPKPNKSSLSSKRDDKSKNPDKKVTLLLNNDNTKNIKETVKTEKKAPISQNKLKIIPNSISLISYFSKWKLRYNRRKEINNIKNKSNDSYSRLNNSTSKRNYSIEEFSILSDKTKELDDEIEILTQHQVALSDHDQLLLIAEATRRRELIRNIEKLRDLISHSTNRASQFQKEAFITERFITTMTE